MINKNKRGWITVLEATISVMIVSGVLMIAYANQGIVESSEEEYIFGLQKQVLSDISFRSDLRIIVLEANETKLSNFVGSKIPPAYRYYIKICDLDSTTDHCKLNSSEYVEIRDKNLYVEEIIISANLGNGTSAVYEPKKVKLYVWENR